jgi:hypothetical protein
MFGEESADGTGRNSDLGNQLLLLDFTADLSSGSHCPLFCMNPGLQDVLTSPRSDFALPNWVMNALWALVLAISCLETEIELT